MGPFLTLKTNLSFMMSEMLHCNYANISVNLLHRNNCSITIINTSVKIYRTKKLNNGSRVTGSAI